MRPFILQREIMEDSIDEFLLDCTQQRRILDKNKITWSAISATSSLVIPMSISGKAPNKSRCKGKITKKIEACLSETLTQIYCI